MGFTALINAINSSGLAINARINDKGDGILIEEEVTGTPGSVQIKIEDTSGSVAEGLRIETEASGTDEDNFIDGSFETVIEFEATDTLDDAIVNTTRCRDESERVMSEVLAGIDAAICGFFDQTQQGKATA